MSFELKALKDICTIQIGKTPSRHESDYWRDGTHAWLSIADMNQGRYLNNTKEYITDLGVKASNIKLIPKNTLVLSYKLSIGKVGITQKPMYTNEAIASLTELDSQVDINYLYWALQHIDLLENADRAAMGKTLNKAKLSGVKIPLPPLEEQRRIASILDQADELRQKRQQAIEKLDQLLQATFIDMFGDPVSNPKGWDKKLLSDLVTIDAPLVEPMEKEFENLLHYGPDRISKDSGKLLPALTAKEDMLISKKFLCDDRHILYSKIRPYLNKVAMVQEKCLCSADVYPVEPKSQLTKHFLWHILRSKSFLDHAETFSNRANIPKINRNQFLQYECIVPTMEAQQKFENISKDIQRQIDFQNLSLESIEKLFSSLQNQAFNGTL